MSVGTVKFFNNAKGFGFITPESGDKDVFVHSNNLIDNITEGDKVSFDVESTEKGPSAINDGGCGFYLQQKGFFF